MITGFDRQISLGHRDSDTLCTACFTDRLGEPRVRRRHFTKVKPKMAIFEVTPHRALPIAVVAF